MFSTIKQHAVAGLVAAAFIAAAFAQGLFNPTGYAGASIVVWAAVIAGLAGGVLPTTRVGALAATAGACLAGIAILAGLSVTWAADQGRAFEEATRAAFYVGLFSLAACTAGRGGRAEWLIGLVVGLGVVSVVSLFAYLQPGVLDSGGSDLPGAAGRLAYPIGYWNATAALLVAASTLLAHAGVRSPSRALRTAAITAIPLAILALWLTGSRGGAAAIAIAWIVLLAASPDRPRQLAVMMIGLAGAAALVMVATQLDSLTNTVVDSARRADGDRMSIVCIAVAALTAAAAWRLDRWRPSVQMSRRSWLAVACIAFVAAVAAIIAVDPGARLHDFEKAPPTHKGVSVGAAELSSNGRWQFWGQAIDAFAAEPLHGVGAGGFESWWGRHGDVALFVRNPHSLPLQEGAELGIPGIALFLGFCATLAIACRRRLAEGRGGDAGVLIALLLAGAVSAIFDWTWQVPAVFGPSLVAASLLLASAPARELGRAGRWLGAGTIAVGSLAAVAAGIVVLSELELSQSRDAASAGHTDQAIDHARRASDIQPWAAEPYIQLAQLELQRGELEAALADIKRAEERDSEDWRPLVVEATLQQRRGDFQAARAAYLQADRMTPLPLVDIVFPPGGQG